MKSSRWLAPPCLLTFPPTPHLPLPSLSYSQHKLRSRNDGGPGEAWGVCAVEPFQLLVDGYLTIQGGNQGREVLVT